MENENNCFLDQATVTFVYSLSGSTTMSSSTKKVRNVVRLLFTCICYLLFTFISFFIIQGHFSFFSILFSASYFYELFIQ